MRVLPLASRPLKSTPLDGMEETFEHRGHNVRVRINRHGLEIDVLNPYGGMIHAPIVIQWRDLECVYGGSWTAQIVRRVDALLNYVEE